MSKKRKQHTVISPAKIKPVRPAAALHPADSQRLLLVLRIGGFVLAAAVIIAWVFPNLRVWGFHHPAFLPAWVSIPLVVAALLLWTPVGSRTITKLSVQLRPLINRSAVWWAIAVAIVFLLLRVPVPLLGDGPLWVKELAWIGQFEARGQHVPGTRFLMRKEPLELGVHELIFRAAAAMRNPDPPATSAAQAKELHMRRDQWFTRVAYNTYSYLSIAAGALFVFMALRFARRRLPAESRAQFLIPLLTGSGMLLFFGYIENYSWASLAMLAFLIAGLDDAFPPRRFPVKSVITFGLAVGFHLSNFILLPALLYLLYNLHFQAADEAEQRVTAPRQRMVLILAGSAIAGIGGYIFVKGWKGWVSIMPLLPHWSKDGYAVLTTAHAVDLINLAVLILLPVALILFTIRPTKSGNIYEHVQSGFLTVAATGGLAFVAIFNPNLGMARDWDLLAMALWPTVLWGAWRLAHADFGTSRNVVLSAMLGFVLLIPVPYILGQVFLRPALQRYETLLHLDRSRSAYGWENIAIYYESVGDLENRIRAWKTAADVSGNIRYELNYAVALRLAGRLDEAEPLVRKAAAKVPDYAYQLVYLAQSYLDKGRLDKGRELLEYAAELDTADAQIPKILDYVNQRIAESNAGK
ncbi:MAG: tetratricopeptide repeat protein [Calditrichota bacterium]